MTTTTATPNKTNGRKSNNDPINDNIYDQTTQSDNQTREIDDDDNNINDRFDTTTILNYETKETKMTTRASGI
jgi:hypothetical protein